MSGAAYAAGTADVLQCLVAIMAVTLLLGPSALVLMRGRWRTAVNSNLKTTHWLPAAIQVCLFAYWALYYRGLWGYLPAIGVQLVYAVVLDSLLSMNLRRRLTINAGPVPVTLSTNLFVLFAPGQTYLTIACITIALLSKALLRRGGRHIFNPSGFGISVVALATLFFPALGYGGSAEEFNLPPNMAEVILLLALIVQFRIPVVLASLGCVAGLHAWDALGGQMWFPVYWSPMTLVVVLLVTDPATMPRTQAGRLLYGVFIGLLVEATAGLLDHAFGMDFYAKILPIPVANLAAPLFTRLGERLPNLRLLAPRMNPAHVLVWFGLVAMSMGGVAKDEPFESSRRARQLHHENRTPFVNFAPDGGVRCADNPLYCRAFTLERALGAWRRRARGASAGR